MIATNKRVQFDAIVIGSGIGGLTVAAILSRCYRKKVLVLEQHFTPGGLTHSFKRGSKLDWEVGINYIGELGKGDLGRIVFDYLTNGQLQWKKLPDPFEKFIYPEHTFDLYADPKRFQADLIAEFPLERAAIRRYFTDIQWASFWFIFYTFIDAFPVWLNPLLQVICRRLGKIAIQSTKSYLDQNFQDERLKALLVSQFATYGLPPSESCFGMVSVIVTHYLHGAWYPVGGGQAITNSIIPTIERSGGMIVTQRRVTEILIESGKAVGVKAQFLGEPDAEPEIYHAPLIVSNIGIPKTYLQLIPPSYPLRYRESIKSFPPGRSLLTLYLGLKEDPRKLGFQGENHWIFTTYDHEVITLPPTGEAYAPEFCLLSFSCLKNPHARGYNVEVATSASYETFAQWKNKPWKRRGADYNALKAEITDSILSLIERHYPGFKDLVAYTELSTPLTFENLGGKEHGCVYGVPYIPDRFYQPWLSARTPIKNLYFSGSDTCTSGVMGAMMGGVKTAGIVSGILGLGLLRVMLAMLMANNKSGKSK